MKRVAVKSQKVASVAANSRFSEAERESIRKFNDWMDKYEPIERQIYAERERRAESKRRRAAARRKAFGDLCEMTDGMAKFCRDQGISLKEGKRRLRYSRPSMYMMGWVALFEITWLAASFLRKELTKRIDRAKHEAIRPYYYEQERARRQALAEDRRKIRMRMTLNACPTKEEILDILKKCAISNNGKEAMQFKTLKTYSEDVLKRILSAIRRSKNYIDVNSLNGETVSETIDILTYSFPCQDLSNVGAFHGYNKGIDKDSGSRSSLLWQVGRILKEMKATNKEMPRYLLMENVPTLLSERHRSNFDLWINELKELIEELKNKEN